MNLETVKGVSTNDLHKIVNCTRKIATMNEHLTVDNLSKTTRRFTEANQFINVNTWQRERNMQALK